MLDFIEYAAAGSALLGVYMATREYVSSWPVLLVSIALYFWVFWVNGLFAYAWLQAFFFVNCSVGWWQWLRGGEQGGMLRVSLLTSTQRWAWGAFTVLASIGIWVALADRAPTPRALEAVATAASIVATWLQIRKKLETWVYWVFVNVVSVWLFAIDALYPTMVLYVIFIGVASDGFRQWRNSYRRYGAEV